MNVTVFRLPIIEHLMSSRVCLHQRLLLSRCLRATIQKRILSTYKADSPDIHDAADHFEDALKVKTVGLTKREQDNLSRLNPDQPEQPRSLKVAVIGSPNAGKSTLVNRILSWRVSAVSKKVHTTRKRTLGILTENNRQIVFLDTPGMITPEKKERHRLEMSLLTDPHSSLFDADLIAVMVDVSNFHTCNSLDPEILKALHLHSNRKSILILNKVDLVKKINLLSLTRLLTENQVAGKSSSSTLKQPKTLEEILQLKEHVEETDLNSVSNRDFSNTVAEEELYCSNYSEVRHADALGMEGRSDSFDKERTIKEKFTSLQNRALWEEYYRKIQQVPQDVSHKHGWKHFQKVFMISALSGGGVEDLKKYLLDSAYVQDWMFHSSLVTDQDPLEMARHCVFERLLDYLPGAMPYQIRVKIIHWETDETNTLRIMVELVCGQKRHVGFLLSKKGELIQKIAQEAKQELMNTFKCEVALKVIVKT